MNVVGPVRAASKESRENNSTTLPVVKRPGSTMSASASTRRIIQRKAPPPFTAQTLDQNQSADYVGTAKKAGGGGNNESDLEQELRTLRFELSQQTEVILLKTETISNLQN